MASLKTKVYLLNGSRSVWVEKSAYVLGKGEPAVEFISDVNSNEVTDALSAIKIKVGDGFTTYGELPYVGDELKAEFLAKFSEIEEQLAKLGNAVFQIEGSALDSLEGATEGDKITAWVTANEPDVTLKEGNIAIVKRIIIAEDADRNIVARYSYTAYAYTGAAWAAMDGNYNAENVYFNDDITFTANIGALSLESGKTKGTYESKGKSLEEVLKGIMAKTIAPTIKQPNYTLDSVTADVNSTVEIGTKVNKIYWKATFTDGSYSYKSTEAPSSTAANCKPTYETSFSSNIEGLTATTSDAAKEDGTYTLSTPYQVVSESATTVATVSTTCHISDSNRTPLNNIGDEVDGKITNVADKTGSKSFSVTGYRAWFCGYKNGDSAIKNPETGAADATLITGDQIRNLGNSANGSWLTSMNVSQMQQMFFAAPAGKGYKPSVADSKTTAPQTVQGPITVYVKGANSYATADAPNGVAYDVWYVNNTSAASGSAGLTIGKA